MGPGGQTDCLAVERYIDPLIEQFSQGYGRPSETNKLIVGTLCCAKYQTRGYYRAKILSVRHDGMVVVQFIDHGNVDVISSDDIHLLDNMHGAESLRTYPAMATKFTLLNVLPVNGVWDIRTIEEIRKSLCYKEHIATIQMMNNHSLIKLWYTEDFSELLVKQRMALPATLEDMFRPKQILQPQMLQPQMLQQVPYQQQNKGNMYNFAAMPMMQNMNQNVNVQGYHKNFAPDVREPKHGAQPILQHPPLSPPLSPPPPPPLPPVQNALVFRPQVLNINMKHEVFISHIEDGPQEFFVQVQSTRDKLTRLMTEINNHPKQPLQEPLSPGSVCLGRYNDTDGERVLCRAVVISVMEHECKLYYVDFGYTEILPYTDIFQLPPEYINPSMFSIRFALRGLEGLIITQEMKEYFKELVYRRSLILRARPLGGSLYKSLHSLLNPSSEVPPLFQYGDLYDNGVKVKDILKKAFSTLDAVIPMTYSYPQLQRFTKDFQEVVHVSYAESYKEFFVQLDSGAKSFVSIMADLSQYIKMYSSPLTMAQLKAGSPCAALYDGQWYRAQIIDIFENDVEILYVDYGNQELKSIICLRTIHDDLVTKLPAQAVKCALNVHEVLSLDEVSDRFNRLTRKTCNRFHMKVVASQPNGLLVDLFEFDTMRSVNQLNNLFCDKTENSTGSRNEVHCSARTNEFQR